MKLIALYKTWDGGEFVDASLASLYDSVDTIVMVHSEISWLGEFGNTVMNDAIDWCAANDRDDKVIHVLHDSQSQEAQYQAGLDFIRDHKIEFDAIMVVDADEVWEPQYVENAKRQIHDNPSPAYRSAMHTYLKTPFYRIEPTYGSPTTFLREPKYLTESPRGCQAPARHLSDVWMHHYTYVRESRDLVERKIHQSCKADRDETVVPNWMTDVYDKLPFGENLHAFEKHRHVWNHVEKIWIDQVPPAMRTAKLMPLWFPEYAAQLRDGTSAGFASVLEGELSALHRLAKGRHQAVDLGTYRGLSAVTLALACDRVHTVDFYDAAWTSGGEYENLGGQSLERTQELCDRFGNMTCENSDTISAGASSKLASVDVLFIDADHSYEGTIGNFHAWAWRMAPNGLIVFHDNNDLHPGVQRSIAELQRHPRLKWIDCGEFSGSLAACEVWES